MGADMKAWREGKGGKAIRTAGPLVLIYQLWQLSQTYHLLLPLPKPAPLLLEGKVLWSRAIDLRVKLPDTWSLKPPLKALDFVAADITTGAVLGGFVRPHRHTAEATLNAEIAKAGGPALATLRRGATKFGGTLPALWAEFARSSEGADFRERIVVGVKARYVIAFTCLGPPVAIEACETVLKHPYLTIPGGE
jgi:hypothetical protein